MEKAVAPHSSTLAWKIPWMEEPGGLQSTGSLRVGHDWATSLSLFTFMRWRRKWQPTQVFLPRESQGWGSLVGCHLWGRTESDTTEATQQQQQQQQVKRNIRNLTKTKLNNKPLEIMTDRQLIELESSWICHLTDRNQGLLGSKNEWLVNHTYSAFSESTIFLTNCVIDFFHLQSFHRIGVE